MIYTDRFFYRPNQKALPNEADCSEPAEISEALIGLIHAEDRDEENASAVEKKLVKNLKWGARKNDTRHIVLHSFSPLAEQRGLAFGIHVDPDVPETLVTDRKNDTRRVVLHSFSHLAESKASPEFTKELIHRAEQRLLAAHYDAHTTPFGYFLDLDLKAPGRSAARIFASF